MHVNDLPERSQDYLKKIFDLQEWSGSGVSLSVLASHMEQRPSTASEAIKRLSAQGLVEHAPYGDIALSETGRKIALAMVRRHRLIETFLCNHLRGATCRKVRLSFFLTPTRANIWSWIALVTGMMRWCVT